MQKLIHIIPGQLDLNALYSIEESKPTKPELTEEAAEAAQWLEADLTEDRDWEWDDNTQGTEQGI